MDSIPTDKRADKQPSVASKFRSGKVKGDIYLKGQVRYLQHGLLTIFFPPMDSLASGPTAIEIPGYVNVLSIPHSVASPSPAVKRSEREPLTTIGLFNSVWSKVWGQVINPLPKINWEHKLDTFREPFHCSNFQVVCKVNLLRSMNTFDTYGRDLETATAGIYLKEFTIQTCDLKS